jgi:hypothetical protein
MGFQFFCKSTRHQAGMPKPGCIDNQGTHIGLLKHIIVLASSIGEIAYFGGKQP